ncbi:transketolase [Holtiella tumoricola]|uniref:transketolase n=1 Tax=Holtiella tumoricola TaxID=3018743 RepID=UPI0026467F22|nr:transketolase [Holtiella tumoricola]
MAIEVAKVDHLKQMNHRFRQELIELLHKIQTGHPGGSLSCTEILTLLYFDKMDITPLNLQNPERDHFILSKGHAAPMLYLTLAEKGFFDKEELQNLRQINSMLQGHPCSKTTPGVEVSTGPLGLGISAGCGIAKGLKMQGIDRHVYVLMGDGEIQEGVVWEAAMSAAKFKLDNLVVILDANGVQLDGTTEEVMPMGDIKAKWEAFGFRVIEANGHDITSLSEAIDEAKEIEGKPSLILAHTVKGKGISFMEGKNIWHGKPISDAEYVTALKELEVEV